MNNSLYISLLLLATNHGVATEAIQPWEVVGITQIIGSAGEDGLHNVRADGVGNLFLAGTTTGPDGSIDMALWKLDSDLQPVESFGQQGCFSMGSSGNDQCVDVAFMGDEIWLLGQVEAGDRDFVGKGHRGKIDIAIIRLDRNGHLLQKPNTIRLLGGSDDDELIVHTRNYSEPGFRYAVAADGGMIIASMTRSTDGDWSDRVSLGRVLNRDILVFKLRAGGEIDRVFGSNGSIRIGTEPGAQEKQQSAHDFVFSIEKDPAGGYLCAGYTVGASVSLPGSTYIPVPGNLEAVGNNDCQSGQIFCYKMDGLVFKFSELGELDTEFGVGGLCFFGGSRQEKFYNTAIDDRGNVLVAGRSSSIDGALRRNLVEPDHFDGVVVRLKPDGTVDPDGILILGGCGDEQAIRVIAGDPTWILYHSDSFPATGSDTMHRTHQRRMDACVVAFGDVGEVISRIRICSNSDEKPTALLLRGNDLIVGGITQNQSDSRSRDIFLSKILIPHHFIK